jgi:hypothetical protein
LKIDSKEKKALVSDELLVEINREIYAPWVEANKQMRARN